ncbi:short-chain collagen C4-like [Mytilus edulis]|uniref:short-chain collagen C4-like n=1 Tax=Mytilus edulis TaxID=6550 RepID=UPI0039EF3DCC
MVVLCLIFFLCFKVNLVTTEEKRLLLNDPDVLVNRLNNVENIVAILNATVRQLTTENKQQAATNQQQEKTIQLQQSSIQQQQMSIQQQNTSIQRHQTLIQQQQVLIKQQEQTVKQLQGSIISIQKFGATYIRWGRKQCPNNGTELVYSGYAGGGYYGESGSAAEYVCLPPDPNYVKTSGPDGAFMYGGEFDTNFFASDSDNEDVPCALCRATQATSVIMIPGKNTCYSDWKEEYHGYLASGGHTEASASAFVCVDINPEYIIGGVDERYGKLFYNVLTKCGSLKCPPYKANYPLTCVVCSR